VARGRISQNVEALAIEAELDRVSAPGNREVVRELVRILEEAARRVAVGAEPLEAADEDVAHELTRYEGEVLEILARRRRLARRGPIERVAEAVDERGGEDVALARGKEVLDVFAAVREIRKRLRVQEDDIGAASVVANENRVALAGGKVQPDVARVEV